MSKLDELSAANLVEILDDTGWSLSVNFGRGDKARDAMRAFSDAIRTGALVEREGVVDRTHLTIAESDRPLAFLELDDAALAQFARQYLIQMERALEKSAGNREMPLSLAMSMHGAIALYRMAFEANAGELHLTHERVVWGGTDRGDWELIVRRRLPDGAYDTRCIGCDCSIGDKEYVLDDNGETGCPACFTEDGSGECWNRAALKDTTT